MICPNCNQEIDFVFVISSFTQKQAVKGNFYLEQYEDVNDAIGDAFCKYCPKCDFSLEGKSYQFLEGQNNRLLKAQCGLGMASEMDSPAEIAVLVSGLHDRIAEYEKPQPQCGHKARYVVSTDEGTSFCLVCAFEGIADIVSRRDNLLNKINRLALLPADASELKDGESDNPIDLLTRISLLSSIGNRSKD